MSDSLKIDRETALAWWCPVDDHSNAQSSFQCGGCGAVRDGDKVTPPGKSGAGGSSEEVAGLKAKVADLKSTARRFQEVYDATQARIAELEKQDGEREDEVTQLKQKLDDAELQAAGSLSYDDLSPEALEVECDKKGVEVTGTGSNGNVLKKDRVAALDKARSA